MKFYVDTSVWGGYDDKEFSEWTIPFFEQAKQGRFTVIISDVTLLELQKAPEIIRNLPTTIPPEFIELVSISEEQIQLADKYVNEGALTNKFHTDAQHIAISSILKVDSLVSWNFKHMVNFFRIRQYNSINLKYGYSTIDIRTPKEVTYEK
ncbi:MAG: PIN domain protein [Pelobium sp.]